MGHRRQEDVYCIYEANPGERKIRHSIHNQIGYQTPLVQNSYKTVGTTNMIVDIALIDININTREKRGSYTINPVKCFE